MVKKEEDILIELLEDFAVLFETGRIDSRMLKRVLKRIRKIRRYLSTNNI